MTFVAQPAQESSVVCDGDYRLESAHTEAGVPIAQLLSTPFGGEYFISLGSGGDKHVVKCRMRFILVVVRHSKFFVIGDLDIFCFIACILYLEYSHFRAEIARKRYAQTATVRLILE